MSHYFTKTPEGEAHFFTFALQFRGRTYSWTSAHGVFSKDQLDFGSRLLLETATIPDGGRVLDVGCGTGAMGLLATVDRPSAWACLVDVNERALECSRRNREAVGSAAGIVQGSFVSAFRDGAFRAILFNPPIRVGKQALYEAVEEMPRVLEPGGQLWVVVRVQQGGKSFLNHLERVFGGDASQAAKKKGYLILRAGTPKADDMSAAHRGAGAGGASLFASGAGRQCPAVIAE